MYDEDSLITACQSGDVAAFEELVHRYQDRTLRVLYLMLGNVDDAQDVAQETFIKAFRCIRSFKGRSSLATWLHRIALNAAHNWIRDNKRARQALLVADDRWPEGGRRPEDLLIARERKMEIRYALAQLPLHYREAIILRHFDEMSYEEIADIQQVPVGTVRSRLAKGRALLQRYMGLAPDRERSVDHGLQEGQGTDPIRG